MTTNVGSENADRGLDILVRKLEEARARHPGFSLRAFAMRLGLSSGALSEILSAKRALSPSVKKKIAPKLLLSPKEARAFFADDISEALAVGEDKRQVLSQDQFHVISEWWYFGLLNLIKTRDFKNQLAWMARRLGLTLPVVAEAWLRLSRLGYIEKTKFGIVRRQPALRTTDRLVDLSVRKSHLEDLALIEKSLRNVPLELRDNLSCTFVIDREDLEQAKEMIRVFHRQFLDLVGKETGNEVYKLSIALYPLTQVTGEQ